APRPAPQPQPQPQPLVNTRCSSLPASSFCNSVYAAQRADSLQPSSDHVINVDLPIPNPSPPSTAHLAPSAHPPVPNRLSSHASSSYRSRSTALSSSASVNRRSAPTPPLSNSASNAHRPPSASSVYLTPISNRPLSVAPPRNTAPVEPRPQPSDHATIVHPPTSSPSPSLVHASRRTVPVSNFALARRRPAPTRPSSDSSRFSYRPIPTTPSSYAAPANRRSATTPSPSHVVFNVHRRSRASVRHSAPVSHFKPPAAQSCTSLPGHHRQQPSHHIISLDPPLSTPSLSSVVGSRRTIPASNSIPSARRRAPPRPSSNTSPFMCRPIPTTPSSYVLTANRPGTRTPSSSNGISGAPRPPTATLRHSRPDPHYRPPAAPSRIRAPLDHRQQPSTFRNNTSIIHRSVPPASRGEPQAAATRCLARIQRSSNSAPNSRRLQRSNPPGADTNSHVTIMPLATTGSIPPQAVPNGSPVRPQKVAMLDFSSVLHVPCQKKYDSVGAQRPRKVRRVGGVHFAGDIDRHFIT
ncbi:unnamed protein product, partial [Agarophyton chilense]